MNVQERTSTVSPFTPQAPSLMAGKTVTGLLPTISKV